MIIELGLLVMYKLLLDLSYSTYLSDLYQYQGFISEFNLVKSVESTMLLAILYLFFRIKEEKQGIVDLILLILILVILGPYTSIYSMENGGRDFFYLLYSSFVIIIILSKLPRFRVSSILIKEKILIKSSISFGLILIIILLVIYGMPDLKAFNFTEVYDIRNENNIPRILSYFVNWQSKIISLLVLAYGLYLKNKKIVTISLIIQIIIYLIVAHKTILFAPILIIVLYFIVNRIKKTNLFYLLSLNLLVAISLIFYKIQVTEWLATLFIRRMLFVPVKNTTYVFEYFQNIGKIKLSNSILQGYFNYPFDTAVYYVIGKQYYGGSVNANANYIADAYLQFGVLGVLFYSVLLGILLWVLKSISFDKPLIITMGAVFFGFYSIIDSSLLTSMLTNGILVGMLLIVFVRKEEDRMTDIRRF